MISIWILAVWNFAVSAWNSYGSGQIYERSDSLWSKVVGVSGLGLGFVGMMYSFILAGIGLGYVGEEFLLASNVILGIPIIGFGIIITIESWMIAVKEGGFWNYLITIYNTVAMGWNIFAWIKSFKEVGGIGDALGEMADDGNDKVMIIVAFIGGLVLSYSLFKLGRKHARKSMRG